MNGKGVCFLRKIVHAGSKSFIIVQELDAFQIVACYTGSVSERSEGTGAEGLQN